MPGDGAAGGPSVASDYGEAEDEAGGAGGGGLYGGGSGGNGGACFGEGEAFEVAGAGGGGGGANFTAADATNVTIATSSRGFGSDGQVTISYVTTTPVITSPVSGSTLPAATVGVNYNTTITAAGVPAPTFTATGLPDGLSIDTNTGVISGTPTTADSYSISVTATNTAGDDTATYTLPVDTAATTTSVTTSGPVTAGSAVTLTGTVTPAPGAGTVGFTLSGTPVSGCTAQPVDSVTGKAVCSTTAPTTASTYPVSADYSGGGGYNPSTGDATLTVTAGALASLSLSPASSSVTAGGSRSYMATGLDQYGNSLGDVTAQTTFSISPDGSCTGSSCTATVAGSHKVTGTDGTATGDATLTVTAGSAASVAIAGGNDQFAVVGQAFRRSLSVTVTDGYGNPVAGATVTFAVGRARGGTASFAGRARTVTATSDSAGVATTPRLRAGLIAGPVAVTASTPAGSGTARVTFRETVIRARRARADLVIAMAAPRTMAAGGSAPVTITVVNKGPQAAAGVSTVFSPSAGLIITSAGGGTIRGGGDWFTAVAVPAGQKVTYTVRVRARPWTAGNQRLLLLAATRSSTPDPRPGNNATTAAVLVTRN